MKIHSEMKTVCNRSIHLYKTVWAFYGYRKHYPTQAQYAHIGYTTKDETKGSRILAGEKACDLCHNHLLLFVIYYLQDFCKAIRLNNKNKQKTGIQNSKKHCNKKEWQIHYISL